MRAVPPSPEEDSDDRAKTALVVVSISKLEPVARYVSFLDFGESRLQRRQAKRKKTERKNEGKRAGIARRLGE